MSHENPDRYSFIDHRRLHANRWSLCYDEREIYRTAEARALGLIVLQVRCECVQAWSFVHNLRSSLVSIPDWCAYKPKLGVHAWNNSINSIPMVFASRNTYFYCSVVDLNISAAKGRGVANYFLISSHNPTRFPSLSFM